MADLSPISGDSERTLDRSQNTLPKVIILGGTGEGTELAARLSKRLDLCTISSLAGRVSQPKHPEGVVRVGGFGGADGLAAYLVKENVRVVVDATHPFAVRISCNAESACAQLGLPLIAFSRRPWEQTKEDSWQEVANFKEAAEVVESRKGRVLLSIGRQEVGSFSDCNTAWFLIRAIEKPTGPLPRHHELLLQRGPFGLDEELRLLKDHSIDYIISKNSGAPATYNKIQAARQLGIPVIMIKRPAKHTLPVVETLEEVLSEVDRLIQSNKATS